MVQFIVSPTLTRLRAFNIGYKPISTAGNRQNFLNGPYNFRGIRGLDAPQTLAFKAAFDPRQLQLGLKLIF